MGINFTEMTDKSATEFLETFCKSFTDETSNSTSIHNFPVVLKKRTELQLQLSHKLNNEPYDVDKYYQWDMLNVFKRIMVTKEPATSNTGFAKYFFIKFAINGMNAIEELSDKDIFKIAKALYQSAY